MQPTVLHVFVSSTWLDLQPERAAVETALQRMRETKLVGMEYFGSRDEDTRRTSLDEVDRSQVYVGIFGGRYGSGITEAEYRRAQELGLPCFIYFKDEVAILPEGRERDPEKVTRLAALKAELRQHHTVSTFTTPDDLAVKVTTDLHRWLFDEYLRRPTPGVPFQAPAVPGYFVPRPEVSQALMDHLIAEVPSGALVVSAIHGLGGIGKTTLVAALAHAPDVQARFSDGVLWATLGQQPDILSLLAGWIQALGDYDFRPTVVESASAHLRTLLHDKACLVVVDDAWQADDVRPCLVGGPGCRLVVTTRNAALARKVGARLYDLDVMTKEQALALFQARLGPLDGDREQAAALARELGYLPLALELAAAQVEAGFSWAELLDAFRRALADLAALDLDEATYRNESLRLSFRLSLEQLSPDDQDAFVWLGVLPEDVRLNSAMAATLWNQPEADARRRLCRLRDRALLKSVGDGRYTLHDLLHDEAKLRLVERIPLAEAHVALLERYRQKAPVEQWHRLLDDGYIHEHLTWHMEQAGQPEAIHALLCMETQEGRNAWYGAREALGQTAGYLEDVRRAWRLADAEALPPSSGGRVGRGVRYALITASLNSLAGNLPPALLAALVKEKVWTPAQGLAYAQQVPEPPQRARALAGLALTLVELGHPKEALAAAREIKSKWSWAKVLAGLAPHLPEAERAEALQEALAAAREIGDEDNRARALAGLALTLVELDRPKEALAAARAIESEWARAEALAGLAPHLPEPPREEALREALAAAREIERKSSRAEALAGLAPHLPEELLREALAAAREIERKSSRAEALAGLAPHLPEELLREALAVAREIGDADDRAEMLAGVAPHLSEELLWEALAAAREIERESSRAKAMAVLAPRLPEELLREALAAAREIRGAEYRTEALAALTPHLPEPLREEALREAWEALAAARKITDKGDQGEALARLASRLMELGYPEKALAAAREIGIRKNRAEALAGLHPLLPESLRGEALKEALTAVRRIEDEQWRARALAGLALHLPEGLLQEALAAARKIGDEHYRAWALAALALRLAQLGSARLGSLWRETLPILAARTRPDLLADLRALSPVLAALGGEEAIAETIRAIRDVGRWWP